MLPDVDVNIRGYKLKLSSKLILRTGEVRIDLFMDARALFETIKILHDPRAFRIRKTVGRMHYSFDNGELDCFKWIEGKMNITGALMNDNADLSDNLNRMMSRGMWDVDLSDGWKI